MKGPFRAGHTVRDQNLHASGLCRAASEWRLHGPCAASAQWPDAGDDLMDASVVGQGVKFERIRRITGYLVGDLDKFNNGKRAEERDRVKHCSMNDWEAKK